MQWLNKILQKTITRIGRVCIKDYGYHSWDLPANENIFTTYFKTELHCSVKEKNKNSIVFDKIG